jgi:hypothetical protein
MISDGEAAALFSRYGLGDVSRISDPDPLLYHAFGLQRGRLSQLLSWKVWWRTLIAGIAYRHWAGRLKFTNSGTAPPRIVRITPT